MRLSSRSIYHHVALSDQGLHLKLDHDFSNNLAIGSVDSETFENVRRFPKSFNRQSLRSSNIFVMTVNKFLTPKYETNGIYPTCVLWDEFPLTSTCTFYSVLNKNPATIIAYGDEMQGYPYACDFFPDPDAVLVSPIHTFGLKGTPYHVFLKRNTRMPHSYSELFLKYFYDKNCDLMLDSPTVSRIGEFVSINKSSYSIKAHHPSGDEFRGLEKSYVSNKTNLFFGSTDFSTLVVTPYAAQRRKHIMEYEKVKCGNSQVRFVTFRPSQGQQADLVILDLVKPIASKFMTNCSLLVALSRFRETMHIRFVPRLTPSLSACFEGYEYDRTRTIQWNREAFVATFVNAPPHFKAEVAKKYPAQYDVNGSFFLDWWFFLCVIELILSKNGYLDYVVRHTSLFYLSGNVVPPIKEMRHRTEKPHYPVPLILDSVSDYAPLRKRTAMDMTPAPETLDKVHCFMSEERERLKGVPFSDPKWRDSVRATSHLMASLSTVNQN